MSSPLPMVVQSSSLGQPSGLCQSVLLSLGDRPSSLLLILPCSCPSSPMALAYSSPDTSWIVCFVDNVCSKNCLAGTREEGTKFLSTLCEHTPKCLKYFFWVRGMAVVFTLVKVARKGKYI